MPSPFLALACALAIAALPAQDRRAIPGDVVDAAGRPVAGAEVILVHAPATEALLGGADLVRTTTDERGRFRAEVFACLRYAAFASAGGDDGVRCSELVTVDAAAPCRLRLQQKAAAGTLRIRGLDAWQDLGPLQLRLGVAGSGGLLPPIPVPADGKVALPPLPPSRVSCELLDAQGHTLYWWSLQGQDSIVVPPQQRLAAEVVDEQQQPVAGAVISWRPAELYDLEDRLLPVLTPQRWMPLATTDANGKAELRVAFEQDPFTAERWINLPFAAGKAGFVDSYSGFTDALYLDGKKATAEVRQQRVLRFVLRAGNPATLTFTPTGSLPAQVLLGANLRVNEEQDGYTHLARQFVLPLPADGRLALPFLPANASALRLLLPPPPCSLPADDPWRRAVATQPLALPVTLQDGRATVDLGHLQHLRLQVFDSTRGPARGAVVLLVQLRDSDYDLGGWSQGGVTDPAGRIALLAGPGTWLVFVADAGSYAMRELELGAAAAPPIELQLQPMPAMRGRVVDADGKPVADARLATRGYGWRGNADAKAKLMLELSPRIVAEQLRQLTTDADGNFTLYFLEREELNIRLEARHLGAATEFLLQRSDDPIEIRLSK